MAKPDLATIPEFYHKYVKLVAEDKATEALASNGQSTQDFLKAIPDEKWDYRYAEGKWSIKELVQHMIDSERIFAYRALCIARGEKQSLPGFDENVYAAASGAEKRNKEELVEEFTAVRKATELLFRSFAEEQLSRTGTANNKPVSVNGIGFITAGHVLHHLNILRERYLQA
jgi:hypothetical protein